VSALSVHSVYQPSKAHLIEALWTAPFVVISVLVIVGAMLGVGIAQARAKLRGRR
jgi:hypothetical protein